MESPNAIRDALAQCHCTDHHWLIFPGHDDFKITDGVKAMTQICEAHWLVTAIFSWQGNSKLNKEPFQVWILRFINKEKGDNALLICEDGNRKELAHQEIEYTDFPLHEGIKLFLDGGVLLLPSEY